MAGARRKAPALAAGGEASWRPGKGRTDTLKASTGNLHESPTVSPSPPLTACEENPPAPPPPASPPTAGRRLLLPPPRVVAPPARGAVPSEAGGAAMAAVREVEIDPEGTFKYILVRLQRPGGEEQRDIVRGTKAAEFHSG